MDDAGACSLFKSFAITGSTAVETLVENIGRVSSKWNALILIPGF